MKKYDWLFLSGLTVWIIGTIHGGFDGTPKDQFQNFTDLLGWTLMLWGIAGDILSVVVIVRQTKVERATIVNERAVIKNIVTEANNGTDDNGNTS